MSEESSSQRIDIKKFDKQTIDNLSSKLVRMLSEAAEKDPDVQGKFHLKIGHIKFGFSKSGHFEVIVGGPGDDEPGGSRDPG